VKPWYERFPDIYQHERDYWLGKGFQQDDLRKGVAFVGTVTIRIKLDKAFEHRAFKLRVAYPPGYPYVAPKVEFLEPRIKRSRHQGVDGAPCLFPPAEWTINLPPSELYAAIERWLGYHLAGHFPRELSIYELPEYFPWTPFSVLAPKATDERMQEKRAGRFSVDELIGQDLGVIWSVDQEIIGKELVDAVAPARTRKIDRHTSRWYRLDKEPPPFENSVELQRVLAEAGHEVEFKNRPRERELIALVFRDEALGEERPLLVDIGVSSKKATPQVGKGWAVRAPQIYVVSHDELFRRLKGVRDLAALEEKRVVCFGLGAIGSSAAIALAREGVGSFVLCDPDTLRPGNVVRHALDLLSVGQFKAEAVEMALARINPAVDTMTETKHLADPGVIAAKMNDASLVLAAIGDDLTEELISEVVAASDTRPALLLARTLHGGDAFRVALMRPGVDACLTCLAEYGSERHPDWIHVPADDRPDIFDDGCATPARPGAGLVSEQAAIFAVARSIELLEGRAGESNHWLWVERAIEGADERLASGLVLHSARFAPRSDCPVCGV
jgi:hypothetical protein